MAKLLTLSLVLVDMPLQCLMKIRDSTAGLADQVVVPVFKKGDWSVCPNYEWITLISPRKVYARVLEKRVPQLSANPGLGSGTSNPVKKIWWRLLFHPF